MSFSIPGVVRAVAFLLLTLGGASAASGQEEPGEGQAVVDTGDIVASLHRCNGPQLDMNFCARDHALAVMPLLEAAASRVRSLLKREREQAAFDKAHKAFKEYVDAACYLDAALVYPGSMGMWSRESCIVRRVAPRIKALDDYADCKSGRSDCRSGTTPTDADLGEIQ